MKNLGFMKKYRIMIIGSAGSGKSFLSRELGKILKIPVFHLDKEHWLPGWTIPDKEDWRNRQKEMISHSEWIIDGNYQGSLDLRIPQADLIIFLNFSKYLCLFRAIKRNIQYIDKKREDMAEGCPERLSFSFLKWIWDFPKNELVQTNRMLREHKALGKTMIFNSPDELSLWLKNIKEKGINPIPSFETDRLFLRGVELKDAGCYKKHFVDYEVIRFLSDQVPWPYPENGVEDFIENNILPTQGKDKWMWGIFFKDRNEELVGVVDLWREGIPENRAYWLGRKFWRKGIMTEAVKPVMDYAFDELGFEKLIFSNAVGNIASRRIKEKTGCSFVGTKPFKFVDPELKEIELWELTKENWSKYNKEK